MSQRLFKLLSDSLTAAATPEQCGKWLLKIMPRLQSARLEENCNIIWDGKNVVFSLNSKPTFIYSRDLTVNVIDTDWLDDRDSKLAAEFWLSLKTICCARPNKDASFFYYNSAEVLAQVFPDFQYDLPSGNSMQCPRLDYCALQKVISQFHALSVYYKPDKQIFLQLVINSLHSTSPILTTVMESPGTGTGEAKMGLGWFRHYTQKDISIVHDSSFVNRCVDILQPVNIATSFSSIYVSIRLDSVSNPLQAAELLELTLPPSS